MMTIGFVGLGRMGAPMAARLAAAGYVVHLFDVDPSAVSKLSGPNIHASDSLRALGALSEIVFLSLPSPKIVLDTAMALAEGGAVRIIVDLSTSGAVMAVELAAKLQAYKVELVDAPVSGGIAGAVAGKLSLLVSGSSDALAQTAPLLAELGQAFVMGSAPGAGQTMKLVNNLLNACAIAITAEGMAFGIKAGLDPARMIEVLNASTGRNSATQDKWPRSVLPRTFDYGFLTALCLKDVRLCLEEAAHIEAPLPIGEVIRERLESTMARFGVHSDFTSVAKLAEQNAKLNFEP